MTPPDRHPGRPAPLLRGALYGLTAAALFGISPPLAKLLLPEGGPLLIAGLLYLGAGAGLLAYETLFRRGPDLLHRESPVGSGDRWLLAGMIVTGGILGPLCMLWSLQRLSGVLGSLLLNLEAPATIGLAVLWCGEHLGRREIAGALLIVSAATFLHYHPQEMYPDTWGVIAMIGACVCWGIDNNLSQKISMRDPVVVSRIKALGAGFCTLSMALLTGQSLPGPMILIMTVTLGFISYGVSLVLDLRALRLIGAAREAGFFSTAPFVGALAAVPILGERFAVAEICASVIMATGVALLLQEHHSHSHLHEDLTHDHLHTHDNHHQHDHPDGCTHAPHAHLHHHAPLRHSHAHVSEAHHRHRHE